MVTRALILFIILSSNVYASSCCGGGGSLPTLITGDLRAKFNSTYQNAASTYQADIEGNINENNKQEIIREGLSFQYSSLINMYWQYSVSIPVVMNTVRTAKLEEQSSGLGDISGSMAYEFLPEIGYNPYRPRGFVFMELKLPTSDSTYTSQKSLRTDSFGDGFYRLTLGSAFQKIWNSIDALFSVALNYSFERELGGREIQPGIGALSSFSLGYSFSQLPVRVGSSLSYVYRPSISFSDLADSQASYYFETGVSLSYSLDDYVYLLSYLDQSFLAEAKNTMLNQTLLLSISRNFAL